MSDNAAADSVQRAILAQHSARHMKGPKMTLPNGITISTMPYLGAKHPGEAVGLMLGDPTSIMKKECVNPTSQYTWRSRRDVRTTADLRAKVLRPVTMEEIDPDNPDAEVIEIVTPTGSGVVWNNMLLCEMPEKWRLKRYVAAERFAIGQLSSHIEGFSSAVEKATDGAYKGTFEARDAAVGR